MAAIDGKSEMTTEVQIKKHRSHLPLLRLVVSCISEKLGLSRKDIEETKNAVSEVCSESINMASDCADENLSIKLSTHGTDMTVEITDMSPKARASAEGLTGDNVYSNVLERICHLADDVELLGEEAGATIRIRKCARQPASSEAAGYVTVLGTATPQS